MAEATGCCLVAICTPGSTTGHREFIFSSTHLWKEFKFATHQHCRPEGAHLKHRVLGDCNYLKYDDEDGKVKMKRKKYRSPPTETSTSKREKQLTSPRGNPRLLLMTASLTPSLHLSWNHGARRLRRHILGSTAAKTRWKQARGAAAELRQPTPWWHRGSQAATIGLIMGLHILEENCHMQPV